MKSSDIFITSGKFKHFRLSTPGAGTHPMGERERLALFNILDCAGKNVLDLFAGSGALGFEAISHGASSVTFVDKNTHAIKENLARLEELASRSDLELGDIKIYTGSVLNFGSASSNSSKTSSPETNGTPSLGSGITTDPSTSNIPGPTPAHFDLVLVDPPYDHPEFFSSESISIYSNFVKSGSTLVLSRPKNAEIPPPGSLKLEKTRIYAGLALDFFLKV